MAGWAAKASGFHSSPQQPLRPGLCFPGTEGSCGALANTSLVALAPPSSVLLFGPEQGKSGQRGLWGCDVALATCVTVALPVSFQKEFPRTFLYIRFQVESNWGNPEYTCVYRVQVHGKRAGNDGDQQALLVI